jgi:hypothetical protein
MIPRRLSSQLRSTSLLRAPGSLRNGTVSLGSNRLYTQPTLPRSRPPAAALAEQDYEPPVFYPPTSHQSSSSYESAQAYPTRSHKPLQLAQPIPSDIATPNAKAQSNLYPSTQLLDALSLISICLRRPESIPRAYQIFKRLLDDSATGLRRIPDADVWANVVEGVASLGREKPGSHLHEIWRNRALGLIAQWEDACGHHADDRVPAGIEKGGAKVYRGWFTGLVRWVYIWTR